MLKIGLTGGIGSGKSTVSKILYHLGHKVYDSDLRAKDLMNKDESIKSQLINFFGPVFMTIHILIISLAQFGLDPYVIVILVAFGILQFIDGNIFLPFLMSGVVKLPAVVVLLSVFFFGAIFGIWGVFFSVPLASFVKSILDNWKYIDS